MLKFIAGVGVGVGLAAGVWMFHRVSVMRKAGAPWPTAVEGPIRSLLAAPGTLRSDAAVAAMKPIQPYRTGVTVLK